MAKSSIHMSDTERLARVITKCYSKSTLALAAKELGAPLPSEIDIFRALIVAKIAPDFDAAVRLVAEHMDNGIHLPEHSGELFEGKVERRKSPRKSS